MQARLSIRAHPRALRRVRRFVAAFGAARGLGRAEEARITILIEELLTNLIRHGHFRHSRPRHVQVTLALAAQRVTLTFADDGPPFDPFRGAGADLEAPLERRPLGQLGIHILRGLADEFSYRRASGRNMVEIVRRIGWRRGQGVALTRAAPRAGF